MPRVSWFVILAAGLLVAACSAPAPATPTAAPTLAATPSDRWDELFLHTPYPFTAPLPSDDATVIDGTYTKVVVTDLPTVHCVRCPEYAPYGGLWLLNFNSGVFRIYHQDTGWRGIASYAVDGDELALFNDPTCPELTGHYAFSLEDGQLTLSDADADPCAIKLRTMNLTQLPWSSCQPPNQEAAISGHWSVPEGCE